MDVPSDYGRFWHSARWPGIELMAAHWVAHRFDKHFHDAYTVGFNEVGCGAFDCRHAAQHAVPGTLNLIEPGETHTGRATSRYGWRYRNFYIDATRMGDLARETGLRGLPL